MLLQFKVNRPFAHVFDHLSISDLLVKTHPIITAADHLSGNTYRISEKAPIGPFTRTFSYEAEIIGLRAKGHVRIQANIHNMVMLIMEFSLTEMSGETHILESVTVKSRLPIASFLIKTIKKQHTTWFENIEQAPDHTGKTEL